MNTEAFYYKNQAFLAAYDPLLAYQLDKVDATSLEFCWTVADELNLVDRRLKAPVYLHLQEGAEWEANHWAKRLPLDKTDVFFVYGLGLGYYYFPLIDWLKENKARRLVFIEDDLRVLRRFLETPHATQIIKDRQVMIYGAPFLRQKGYAWKNLARDVPGIFWAFCRSSTDMTALQSYFYSQMDLFDTLTAQWYATLGRAKRRLTEFLDPITHPIFRNFYANMPYIWQSIPADALFGQLPCMPTILAGAGPSLDKQLALLKKQTDHALLLAGGSGMNAVTRKGVMPHAGAAIDPNRTQASRQLSSFAFEVPTFYQNRYYAEAFLHLHGPHLYVCGSGDFPIGNWFEKELGIASSQEIIRGVSSSNFLVEIAALLGCDPLILVGTDLAYTEDLHYASGVVAHPTEEGNDNKLPSPNRLAVAGLAGQQVFTKLEWCLEAMCMTDFKERHLASTFVNATEGGMPIEKVPNVSFQSAIDSYLSQSWDVQGLLHGAIQNASTKNEATETRVLEVIETWNCSLKAALEYLKNLRKALGENKTRFLEGDALPFGLYSGRAALWEIEFQQEIVYTHLIQIFDVVFSTLHKHSAYEIARASDARQKLLKEFSLEAKRLRFFEKQIRYHIKVLNDGKKAYCKTQQALRSTRPIAQDPMVPVSYLDGVGNFVIDEPSLGLHLKTKFQPELVPQHLRCNTGQESKVAAIIGEKAGKLHGQSLYFYPSGKVKIESYYEDGQLYGPWRYFAEDGSLLVESWFINSLRQGRSNYYYLDGRQYSTQTYRNGLPHGQWRYYYPAGELKTVLNYEDGQFHGAVRLYYSNGCLKRELHFQHGQLCGEERMWTVKGALTFETSYGELGG